MKPKVILYIAISRDGFIADKNGGVSWLEPFNADIPADFKYGYPAFFASIDCIAVGKTTYEQMLTFGDWPNAGKHSYVFTDVPLTTDRTDISFVSANVKDFMQQLEADRPGCRLWLEGGANLAQQFYDANLIDEYIITEIPIDLHEGIALPRQILDCKDMQEADSTVYSNGIAQKHYFRSIQ